VVLAVVPASAVAELVNLSWDNDFLTGTDRGYTNGVRLAYLSNSDKDRGKRLSGMMATARDKLAFLPGIGSPDAEHAVTASLRQLMVTPGDISEPEPQYNDIPYVGHLALSTTFWSWTEESITGFGGHLGVIGPESGAEAIQKWVHKATGSEKPRGWGNQLGTDVVGGLQVAHARKLFQTGAGGDLQQRVAVIGSGLLSSFRTSVKTGAIWQFGRRLPVNFVPEYSGTSSTIALPASLNTQGSGWSVFVGLGLEYVGYSYIDDNSGPYRFDEGPVIGQLGIGAAWQWNRVHAGLIFRATTGEDDRHKDNFSFGTLSLSWEL